MQPVIFVVDSVAERRSLVQSALETAGHRVEVFATTHALEVAEQDHPDVIVIAAHVADGNGVDLCERVRRMPQLSCTRIIFWGDPTPGRNVPCADVSINAGVELEEIILAVQTVLRQRRSVTTKSGTDIVINSSAMRVAVRGKEIATTTLEFRLIDFMARHQGKVFSRDALLDAVWGDLQFVTPRSVDACVRRIRRKIEAHSSSPTLLKSVRGIGYKLEARPVWEAQDELCRCPTCSAARMRSKVSTSHLGRDLEAENSIQMNSRDTANRLAMGISNS
jgi:DNA-binding response OmpR family regulator